MSAATDIIAARYAADLYRSRNWHDQREYEARFVRAIDEGIAAATAEEKDAALKHALSAAHAAFNSPELLGDCAIMVAESPIHVAMGAKRRAVVEIEEDDAAVSGGEQR